MKFFVSLALTFILVFALALSVLLHWWTVLFISFPLLVLVVLWAAGDE